MDRSECIGPPDARRAFTLIELFVVITIIGIWAAIAIPKSANAITHYRADSAVNRIVKDLALAQEQARTSSASQTVTFDVPGDSYELVGMQHLGHSSQAYTVSLREDPYGVTLLSVGFSGDSTIIFDGYGKPDSGGSVVIGVGGHKRTISLNPDTGEAIVQ